MASVLRSPWRPWREDRLRGQAAGRCGVVDGLCQPNERPVPSGGADCAMPCADRAKPCSRLRETVCRSCSAHDCPASKGRAGAPGEWKLAFRLRRVAIYIRRVPPPPKVRFAVFGRGICKGVALSARACRASGRAPDGTPTWGGRPRAKTPPLWRKTALFWDKSRRLFAQRPPPFPRVEFSSAQIYTNFVTCRPR